jgi:hypothetical protein
VATASRTRRKITRYFYGVPTPDEVDGLVAVLKRVLGGRLTAVSVINRINYPEPMIRLYTYARLRADWTDHSREPFRVNRYDDYATVSYSLGDYLHTDFTASDHVHPRDGGRGTYFVFKPEEVRTQHRSPSGDLHECVMRPHGVDPLYRLKPEWRTDHSRGVARTIVEDERPDLLPVLADALEDAGCTRATMLARMRDGIATWVPDLVLHYPEYEDEDEE